MCASSDGSKVLGLQILAANQKLDQLLAQNAPPSEPVGEFCSLRPNLTRSPRVDYRRSGGGDSARFDSPTGRPSSGRLRCSCYRIYSRKSIAARYLRPSVLVFSSIKVFATLFATSKISPFWISNELVCWTEEPKAIINLAQVALLRKDYTQALELATRFWT